MPEDRYEGAQSRQQNTPRSAVDDEPVNLHVFMGQLAAAGYGVVQARNGEEALSLLESRGAVDLVLLDVMMPRMSGYEVCRRIRSRYLRSELPVIMVTAKDRVVDPVEGLTSGANDYLARPVSKHELVARIRTHLDLYNINRAYGRFVPREFLRSLGRDSIVDVTLGDQVHGEMTILFSDIRDYSALAEAMSPEENFNFLNGYFGRIGLVIRQSNGFVNQYYGDGVMAPYLGGADDVVGAAIAMQKEVDRHNEQRRARGRVPIRIGVGLHTGPLMLGIIGDEERLSASVVSDAVNTAARMEGLTRFYGVRIIVSEGTVQRLQRPEAYERRFLGRVQVKGKQEALSVFEVLNGDRVETRRMKVATTPDFEEGLRRYFAREFAEASVCFNRALKVFPEDHGAKLYLQRSGEFMVHGVAVAWEGLEAWKPGKVLRRRSRFSAIAPGGATPASPPSPSAPLWLCPCP